MPCHLGPCRAREGQPLPGLARDSKQLVWEHTFDMPTNQSGLKRPVHLLLSVSCSPRHCRPTFNHPKAWYQTTKDHPHGTEPSEVIQTWSAFLPWLAHSFPRKLQRRLWPRPSPDSPRPEPPWCPTHPPQPSVGGVECLLVWELWITNCYFHGSHLPISWPRHTWIKTKSQYILKHGETIPLV